MAKLYSGDAGTDSVLSDAGLDAPRVNSWSTSSTVGDAVTISYDWMTSAPANAPAGGFQVFSAVQRAGAERAMNLVSEVANVEFNYSSSGTADIEFGTLSFGGSPNGYTAGLASRSWTINSQTTYYTQAQVYLTNSFSSMLTMSDGSVGFATMVHELGHAIGLDHPFENRLPPPGTDNEQYSVMSYTGHPDMNVNPSSFLLYDIAALQYLYGANMETRTSDTVYQWDKNERVIEAIWDAGGKDTIDASNQTRRANIDLREGSFSSIGQDSDGSNAVNNIAIADGAAIENAAGGAGNDSVTGNALANRLDGNDGNDTLNGKGGNDYFVGGDGADQIIGGSGTDWIGYYDSDAAVDINLSTGAASGGHADGDTFTSIERVTGSNVGDDDLRGNSGDNYLRGYGGNDYFVGGDGADQIRGGSGTDWIGYYDSDAAVDINLSTGAASGGHADGDTFTSIERVTGSNVGDDDLRGNSGDNYLRGYGGNDYFVGGDGADQIRGGSGIDWIGYYDSDAAVRVRLDTGSASGGHATGDTFSSIERITGSNGFGDELRGNSGDNYLRGYGGDDYLVGYDGADQIRGGSGVDWVSYYSSDAGVTVNLTTGETSGGHAEGDTLSSIERITGSNGFGDDLRGNAEDNYLRGYGGDDILAGGKGNDDMIGGIGADIFVFEDDWGDDTITDFDAASDDNLDFSALGVSINDLNIDYRAVDTLITYDGNSLLLEGVTEQLTADEFTFV